MLHQPTGHEDAADRPAEAYPPSTFRGPALCDPVVAANGSRRPHRVTLVPEGAGVAAQCVCGWTAFACRNPAAVRPDTWRPAEQAARAHLASLNPAPTGAGRP